jgi:hypothetical protein
MRAPRLLLAAVLIFCACGGAEQDPEESQDITTTRNVYKLVNAPVASTTHPTALVYLPKGFNPDGELNLVVHYHGWTNCIANDAESTNRACTPGAAARTSHHLIAQMDSSGANAALVLVEIHYDQSTSDDGKLANAGFFKAMIDELLPKIGALAGRTYTEDDLGKIVLTSHSGGYQATAHTIDRGGLTDHITQVILLDSAYAFTSTFEAWAKAAPGQHRLAVVYTDYAGTEANAQHLATDAHSWGAPILDDRTFATQPDSAFASPLIFKRSALSHDGTAQYYFARLIAHAGL